ncbi:MAG: restriction endonuclease [Dysgonamonadaceae bacterium]|jgi:restriction system protein|nr:restriction endonuclease [Dysgonamonadaceae bacterium]
MIPDFQTIMLPLLETFADKKEYKKPALVEIISDKFQLTKDERIEMYDSGSDYIIWNRVGWSMTYLKKAGLLETPKRGSYLITKRGLEVLSTKPTVINLKFLKQFPEYLENLGKGKEGTNEKSNSVGTDNNAELNAAPEELLEYSYSKLKEELAIELIEKIKECSPNFFERLVVDLLIKMGYGGSRKEAGRVIGKSGDGGIDGIINEDKLGLDSIYIQAKKWEKTVPVGQVRDFAGSLLSKKAKKGIFISTSDYPKSAYDYVASIEHRIVLIDGKELAELMIEHGVGVSTKTNYEIKKMDTDYFEE